MLNLCIPLSLICSCRHIKLTGDLAWPLCVRGKSVSCAQGQSIARTHSYSRPWLTSPSRIIFLRFRTLDPHRILWAWDGRCLFWTWAKIPSQNSKGNHFLWISARKPGLGLCFSSSASVSITNVALRNPNKFVWQIEGYAGGAVIWTQLMATF
jgi:hypothetical protein